MRGQLQTTLLLYIALYEKESTFSCNLFCSSLNAETWLEVEKNETVKICMDSKVRTWETSLASEILNASCLKIQVPTLIGVYPIHVQFPDSDSLYKINLAVGMKYLDFKNEEVHYGYDLLLKAGLSRKNVSVTGKYLVDKYPVTNCEILHTLWEDIPSFSTSLDSLNNDFIKSWMLRKHNHDFDDKCSIHDSAVTLFPLYLAMKYANARSIQEGLKPYYFFRSDITLSEKQKVIGYIYNKNDRIWISIDSSSDGYRLLYYDEWMMFARGGDRRNAPWDDSTSFYEYMELRLTSGPVGMFSPNGYGIYDVFGLVKEHVLFEENNKMKRRCEVYYVTSSPKPQKGVIHHPQRLPRTKSVDYLSCFKGGGNLYDNWEKINYGTIDYSSDLGGFRLIRNIGNNAKWTEVKSK